MEVRFLRSQEPDGVWGKCGDRLDCCWWSCGGLQGRSWTLAYALRKRHGVGRAVAVTVTVRMLWRGLGDMGASRGHDRRPCACAGRFQERGEGLVDSGCCRENEPATLLFFHPGDSAMVKQCALPCPKPLGSRPQASFQGLHSSGSDLHNHTHTHITHATTTTTTISTPLLRTPYHISLLCPALLCSALLRVRLGVSCFSFRACRPTPTHDLRNDSCRASHAHHL